MGAGPSASAQTLTEEQKAILRTELAKPVEASDIDTPRGQSAKAEVARLRSLIAANSALLKQQQTQQQQQPTAAVEESSSEEESSDEEEDTRKSCQHCSRKFHANRVEKHESVCTKRNQKPPVNKNQKADSNATLGIKTPANADTAKASNAKKKWEADRMLLKQKLKNDKLAMAKSASTPVLTTAIPTSTPAPSDGTVIEEVRCE